MSRILLVDHMKYINEKRRGFKLTLIPDLILPGKGQSQVLAKVAEGLVQGKAKKKIYEIKALNRGQNQKSKAKVLNEQQDHQGAVQHLY